MPETLVITDKFAPHAGGTAVVWGEWCRRWPGDRVRVVTRAFPGCREHDLRHPARIVRVPFVDVPKVRMPLLWGRLFLRALRECARDRPQVLHVGQILETGLYAPWLRRRFGIPYLVHTFGEEINTYGSDPRLRRWMRRVLDGAAGVTAVSTYTECLLRERLGYAGPVCRVAPGVAADRFTPGDGEPMRRRLELGSAPVLLTVGRLMRRKGHDTVLEALPSVRERYPEVRYLIAGTGPEEARLRRLVRERRLESAVRFLGRVPDADLPALLRCADVFVHPNRVLPHGDVEGFGIVFLEASACGVPVIGGDSGGAPDAVRDGVTGFLVDPCRPGAVAERILALLEDEALRRRLGAAGRAWASEFTWDAAAAKVWELSCRVAARTAGPGALTLSFPDRTHAD